MTLSCMAVYCVLRPMLLSIVFLVTSRTKYKARQRVRPFSVLLTFTCAFRNNKSSKYLSGHC